jgi:dihydroorotate dehydrogenase
MLWPLIRSILFLLPPETVHTMSKTGMKWMTFFMAKPKLIENNPIGLAAGFDKNCEFLPYLPYFGFGYAEIGTVTPKPQGGNERPRLFRIVKDKNLFNRMGFNNLGAGIISERLKKIKPTLPLGFKVGVNLGKNKSTPDTEAASDYAKVAYAFMDHADYFVINVSSPNTPGLRALQTKEFLVPILSAVQNALPSHKKIPIYVKLAPEIEGEALSEIFFALKEAKVDGYVLTNTVGGVSIYRGTEYTGGFSGQILSSLGPKRLIEARKLTSLPILSVGGIMNEDQAIERLRLGANAIQLYTGWIYEGPFFAKRILKRWTELTASKF